MNMSNNKQANAAAENDERVLNLIDLVGKNVPDVLNISNNTQANAAAENDERVLNLIDLVGKNVPDVMNMSNNTQANAAAENDERVLNLIDLVGKNVPDVMNMSNNTQANTAPENVERVLNLIDLVGKNVPDVVENSGISKSVNSPNIQVLKLGSSRTETFPDHEDFQLAVEPSGISMSVLELAKRFEAQLKLRASRTEKGKDPVRELNLAEAIAEQVAATTEAGDGAIPIPRKKHKISWDEDSSKWNERLMEECHITPIAAPELVVENGQMADAPKNGGLRRSTRPRKPNTRLKGYYLNK